MVQSDEDDFFQSKTCIRTVEKNSKFYSPAVLKSFLNLKLAVCLLDTP